MIHFRRVHAPKYKFWFWVLVLINAGLIVAVLTIHSIIDKQSGVGRRFPPLEAMDRSGHLVQPNPKDPCWAIRFTSRYCTACEQDRVENWPRLRKMLIGRGCRIFYIQRSLFNPIPPDDDRTIFETDLWAVSPRFATESGLSHTPTTILLNAKDKIVWRHIGILSDSDVWAAIHSIPARADQTSHGPTREPNFRS